MNILSVVDNKDNIILVNDLSNKYILYSIILSRKRTKIKVK